MIWKGIKGIPTYLKLIRGSGMYLTTWRYINKLKGLSHLFQGGSPAKIPRLGIEYIRYLLYLSY